MESSKFLKTALRIVRENPDVFSALEEYDRTHKLRKLNYKTRANFTIDADLFRRFRTRCKEKGLSMSKIVEKHLQEELKKNSENTSNDY